MTVRELLQRLLDHALDGRGASEDVLVKCDGQLRTIAAVQARLAETEPEQPNDLFVLVVADGPADVQQPSSITMRAPRP
jgi:hypothetical protein